MDSALDLRHHPLVKASTERQTIDDLLRAARSRIRRLEPRAAFLAVNAGAVVVDIRATPDRERNGIVPGSLHIPRTVLEWRLDPASPWRSPYAPGLDDELLLLCDHGFSSSLAAAVLVDLGFAAAGDVVGGYAGWLAAGLPTAWPRDHALASGELVGTRPPER